MNATTVPVRRYDVVLFDDVGVPYTGSTPDHHGLGGSELEAILLAEALVRRGISVLVLNGTLVAADENGVHYDSNAVAQHGRIECRALIVARHSTLPPVKHERLVYWVTDVPGDDRHDRMPVRFQPPNRAAIVALSPWQRTLFPLGWPGEVIPFILPESVYEREPVAPNPRRFVYASAAVKGLRETLDAWRELKQDPALSDLELVVCHPGYDAIDEAELVRAGVTFLGSLPFEGVVEAIEASAGLFYVNTFPETFCIVAALAEALGRRVHVLCTQELGALPEVVRSSLVTLDRQAFFDAFRAALASPDDARWRADARDYHEDTVMPAWMRVLGLDGAARVEATRAPTLCLNMIVKDEAHVIERCLASLKPILSHWVIVDTGSTDGTQDIVRRCMQGVPGTLHERPWKDFGSNRTEAIDLARGTADYLIVVDADDVIEVQPQYTPADLVLDWYELRVEDHRLVYYRPHVFRAGMGFRYEGVLHEALTHPQRRMMGRLESLVYRRLGGGARSTDPDRKKKDIAVLEEAVRADASNPRHLFYLAEALQADGEKEKALAAYERRAGMAGWVEEAWVSLLKMAHLRLELGEPDDAVIAAFLRAYERRPQRAEPLCALAAFCRARQRFALGHVFASTAITIPRPNDQLWMDESIYQWRCLDEYAIASYYVGRHKEAIDANRRLLGNPALPESERARIRTNMEFSTKAVAGPGAHAGRQNVSARR